MNLTMRQNFFRSASEMIVQNNLRNYKFDEIINRLLLLNPCNLDYNSL
jgi:hypothetical protein